MHREHKDRPGNHAPSHFCGSFFLSIHSSFDCSLSSCAKFKDMRDLAKFSINYKTSQKECHHGAFKVMAQTGGLSTRPETGRQTDRQQHPPTGWASPPTLCWAQLCPPWSPQITSIQVEAEPGGRDPGPVIWSFLSPHPFDVLISFPQRNSSFGPENCLGVNATHPLCFANKKLLLYCRKQCYL